MCGIVGIATSARNGLHWNEGDMFKSMLFLDQLRGMDSTGCFSVSNKGNVNIIKEASHGTDFVRTKEFDDFKTDAVRRGQFVVGHNRAATKGSVKDENAHPFWVDDKIILVQNGTYKGSHKHLKDTEVDTHAVAHVIAEEEDVEKALQRINAAYALVWYDVSKKTLNLIRNDERPLWIAYTKKGSMVFASEFEFILFAASRAQVELEKKPFLLAEHNLYSLTLDEQEGWVSECKEVDAKYRFQHEFSILPQPSRRHSENDLVDENGVPWYMHRDNMADNTDDSWEVQLQRGHPRRRHSVLDLNVHTYVHRNRFVEMHCDESVMDSLIEKQQALTAKREFVNIEFFDYLPGNNLGKDCNTWVIVGRALDVDEKAPSLLYYYNLFGEDEKAAMEAATTDNFHRCSVLTCTKHKVGTSFLGTALIDAKISLTAGLQENVQ